MPPEARRSGTRSLWIYSPCQENIPRKAINHRVTSGDPETPLLQEIRRKVSCLRAVDNSKFWHLRNEEWGNSHPVSKSHRRHFLFFHMCESSTMRTAQPRPLAFYWLTRQRLVDRQFESDICAHHSWRLAQKWFGCLDGGGFTTSGRKLFYFTQQQRCSFHASRFQTMSLM